MPNKEKMSGSESVLFAVNNAPEGIAINDLLHKLGETISRRTLQRTLTDLITSGKISTLGQGRGVKYYPRSDRPNKENLAPQAWKIKQYVCQSINSRKSVNYNRKFLDDYQPNITFYLPKKVRQKLHTIGNIFAIERPAGTYARQMLHQLLIDLSWNSSRLEGNTYSLLETERLLDFGERVEGKSLQDAQMLLNHKAAIEFLVESANEEGFSNFTVLNLHALLSDNLLSSPNACGRLRTIPVGIGKTVYKPSAIPQLIMECFQAILTKATTIVDPFEQAFFVMVHLPYLQPFEDVNKRVSRLAANIPLIRENLCPVSFLDVSTQEYIDGILGVYELNKTELLMEVFIWAYERSAARYAQIRHTLGEPDPFRLKYRAQMMEITKQIVESFLTKETATRFLQQWAAKEVPVSDRLSFVGVVETELSSLHEGNIARYRISVMDFQRWHASW